ncbi:MAG: PadR family transcriptional regulator [Candidatus Hodarchaeales archaeon]
MPKDQRDVGVFPETTRLMARWEKDLRRGLLQLIILMFIRLRTPDAHGYGLIRLIQETGIKTIKAGTVYPLLQRMENDGLIESFLSLDTTTGISRKMYVVTSYGEAIIDQMVQIYGSYDNIIQKLYQEIEEERIKRSDPK